MTIGQLVNYLNILQIDTYSLGLSQRGRLFLYFNFDAFLDINIFVSYTLCQNLNRTSGSISRIRVTRHGYAQSDIQQEGFSTLSG